MPLRTATEVLSNWVVKSPCSAWPHLGGLLGDPRQILSAQGCFGAGHGPYGDLRAIEGAMAIVDALGMWGSTPV